MSTNRKAKKNEKYIITYVANLVLVENLSYRTSCRTTDGMPTCMAKGETRAAAAAAAAIVDRNEVNWL